MNALRNATTLAAVQASASGGLPIVLESAHGSPWRPVPARDRYMLLTYLREHVALRGHRYCIAVPACGCDWGRIGPDGDRHGCTADATAAVATTLGERRELCATHAAWFTDHGFGYSTTNTTGRNAA